MDSPVRSNNFSEGKQHKRTTSSVIKSIIPGNHQRKPTATGVHSNQSEGLESANGYDPPYDTMLPPDHPHTRRHLREGSGNRNQRMASPKKSGNPWEGATRDCGEKINMTASSLIESSIEEKNVKSPKKRSGKGDKPMKKSKSSTSLSALLSRPRSSKGLKGDHSHQKNDKENQTPPSTGDMAPPPIWAQFATQGVPALSSITKIPLNDRRSVDEEIRRSTPGAYSLLKQRNFQGYQKPTLSGRSDSKPRPKSECLVPRPTRESFAETVSDLRKSEVEASRRPLSTGKPAGQRPNVELRKSSDSDGGSGLTTTKRGSRVMAAVAAFNGNGKELPREPIESLPNIELDPQAVESAFESLLDARNVPQNTRDKMRSLDTKIKADFVSKDIFGSGSASSVEGLSQHSSRPNSGKRSKTDVGSTKNAEESTGVILTEESPKKSRPRSRTFTFSKGDQSPSNKQKAERPGAHKRNESSFLTPSSSSKSLTSSGTAQGLAFFNRSNKPAAPEDYIGYLRKVQQPEKVEVAKIHKLRQLLRNETVGWVDDFIAQGGMTELVELLYRIIKVEWRVEHEDSLLHETLLCLKALSTTSSALDHLSDIQSILFPVLLGMLFDKEKKGPSEFTTRGIIITLLHTYVTCSHSLGLASRSRLIMSYLRDPSAPEEAQAPEFITTIYHPRPYRVWNKELDNVTKEVFWIFLHHVNIIPYPKFPETCTTYTERHFPRDHPPVPAAPYIGGVEWDATNYFTAHIDLMNGLIASLPTQHERNAFRQELKDSGFEKIMGVSLRTCKESLYGCVHEALSTWVGAAMEDGWPFQDVRQGPPRPEPKRVNGSPNKSPKKRDQPPKLEMPKLELGGAGDAKGGIDEGGWL